MLNKIRVFINKYKKYIIIISIIVFILIWTIILVNNNSKTITPISINDQISDYTKNLSNSSEDKKQAFNYSETWDYLKSIEKWEKINEVISDDDLEKNANWLILVYSYLNYWNYYYKETEYSKKALDFLDTLTLSKNNSYVLYYRWYAHEIIKDYEKAMGYYELALKWSELDNRLLAIIYNQIWHIYSLKWEINIAYENFLKAYEYDNTNVWISMNIWRSLVRFKKLENALIHFNYALENTNNNFIKSEILYNMSSIMLYSKEENKINKSLKLANQSIDINPDYPFWYLAVWKVLYFAWKVNFEKAKEALNKSIELNKNNYAAYETLGLIDFDSKNYKAAIMKFTKWLSVMDNDISLMKNEINSNTARLKYFLVISYSQLWENNKAINLLDEVILLWDKLTLILLSNEIKKENNWFLSTLKWEEKFETILEFFN